MAWSGYRCATLLVTSPSVADTEMTRTGLERSPLERNVRWTVSVSFPSGWYPTVTVDTGVCPGMSCAYTGKCMMSLKRRSPAVYLSITFSARYSTSTLLAEGAE